ncbi:Hypothetical predicted protein [Olea europaea subsp. europaea]|uniref:Uncharacterized protein n=1 Tax=Olea europaea subsp. europaea TaxID=158383 RepID=A0A8S0RS77_OLEEU|nr:Hypothetical predicted protein [Olea europaea subsp. europaea]
MTPRGSTSENFIERKDVDYAIAPEIVEVGTFPSRKSSTLAKRGVASNAAVHELLERPICMNVMCPPIHQVVKIPSHITAGLGTNRIAGAAPTIALVTGDIPFLVAHLKNDHKVDMHDGVLLTTDTSRPNPKM